jgi:putative addiction module component
MVETTEKEPEEREEDLSLHERLWAEEAERRFQEMKDGSVEGIPAKEVLARLRAALR